MHLDEAISALAARQHGVVSRQQLLALGASVEAVRHRVRVRRLMSVHAGVYAVGHDVLPLYGRYMGAVLACGEGAVLSHRAAAALWELRPAPGSAIDVTIPRGGSRHRRGIAVHVTRRLPATETTVRHAIPCTTPARTLVDLAGTVPRRTLDRALEQSLILRLFDRTSFDAAVEAARGRKGVGTLRHLLDDLADEPASTRSELERRFRELVHAAGLPAPLVNEPVAGHEADFHWPAHRLVVETDGGATHDTPRGFERDHRRDLDLELEGWHVIRLTWRQVTREPHRVIALLRRALGSRAA